MNQVKRLPVLGSLCAVVLLVMGLLLAGCAPQAAPMTEEQAANRQYMTQVNQIMDELSSKLQSFDDAVSRGDVVTMRTQADNAFKTLDQLSSLQVPDDLKDVQTGYVNGTNSLKDALSAYVQLYTEIDTATNEHPFDYNTYDARIKSIQDSYNNGISQLQSADQTASSL